MATIIVVVAHVFGEQSLKMGFVQNDDVVEHLFSCRQNPSLRDAVLPWGFVGGLHWGDAPGFESFRDEVSVFSVAVHDNVSRCGIKWTGFSDLLHDPSCGGMIGNGAMHDLSSVVADEKEDIQQSKGNVRHGEEVDSGNGVAVVFQKGEPLFQRILWGGALFQISGDGFFADPKAELEKLCVDARRAPVVFRCHFVNEVSQLLFDF